MMDIQHLTSATSQFDALALGVAFVAGIAASLGPTSYALVPAIVGFGVGVASDRRLMFSRAAVASLAIILVSATIGAIAGMIGATMVQWFGTHIVILYAVGSLAFAFVGMRFLGLLRISALGFATPQFSRVGLWDAFALGSALAIAACPACTPMLLAVILGAAAIAHPLAGAVLLAAFGVGRTLPIFALAISANLFGGMRFLRRYVGVFERIGGALLLLSAIYLLYEAVATSAALHTGSVTTTGMPSM